MILLFNEIVGGNIVGEEKQSFPQLKEEEENINKKK